MVQPLQDQPVEGRFDGTEHRFPVRIYFEDTDLSGVVYHANYLRYMERARSDMLRLAGIGQRAAQEAGEGAYAVSSLAIRYRRPAKLDDALIVVTRLTRIGAASVDIHQRVMLGAEMLTEAEVTAALVGVSGTPKLQPSQGVAPLQRLVDQGDHDEGAV